MALHFGQKVKAHPNTEEALVGFVVNPEEDANGKYGVQVGGDLYGLEHKEDAEEGSQGGTFSLLHQ